MSRQIRSVIVKAVIGWTGLLICAAYARPEDCRGLVGKKFQDAVIVETDDVSSALTMTGLDSLHGVTIKLPFCRVRGILSPSADSNIIFEVWLPPASAWNGRYEGVGNGGFAGSLVYPAMNNALQAGFAVSATDTGHSGSASQSSWALGHPEKIEDLGWRSIHETSLVSKAIAEAYYGKPPAHSYFNGCSTGGRQGLVEAQRFPKDYDGIVVGAPANWPYLLAADLATAQYVAERPENWVSPAKLRNLAKAALVSCHAENGVIDDPSQCHFDPSNLLCKGNSSDECLTSAELQTVREIYTGLEDAAGKSIYPGFPPGTEAVWSSAKIGPGAGRVAESSTYPYPTGYFSNFVFDDPRWDFRSISPIDALAKALNSQAGKAVDVANPDLSAFRAAGGKMIQYHGWSDPAIPAGSSIRYYESVAANMGGIDNIQSFYRLFLAPGMSHCAGGSGPNAIGGAFSLPAPIHDPEHDVIAALARWVEQGEAPATITATLYRDNDPGKGIAAQRPWCVYPAIARYSGKGDRLQASSYICTPPGK
jgi:Tannase and feruloyl esterase